MNPFVQKLSDWSYTRRQVHILIIEDDPDIRAELKLLLENALTDVVSKNQIEEAVVKIITENQNNDKETGLGEVGSRLVKLYPDFDVRRYGYSLLSKFLETFPKLKLKQDGTQVTVTVYEDKSKKEMLEEYIIMLVQNAGAQGVSLGTLGNKIRNRFGDFKVRDYGYSQFKQYIQSFPEIQIRDDGEQNWAVYGKNYKGV